MTDRRPPADPTCERANGGFTLIEVLIAMVLLAVGLLGLEALGASVARSLVFADRQSEFTVEASAELEDVLRQFRTGTTPPSSCTALPNGDRISRSVTVTNTTSGTTTTGLGEVVVTYLPSNDRRPVPPAVTVRGSTFSPAGLAAPDPAGSECSDI